MTAIWNGMDQATLDRAYNARATVPDFAAEMRRYAEAGEAARAALALHEGLVFDPASGNRLDWFPGAPGGPALLWIHGGYWRALGRADNHCVAPGLVAAGAHVAVMDYTLVPGADLDEMVRQVRAATAWVAGHMAEYGAGRLFVGGHSAGGQLAGMVAAPGWDAPEVAGVVALSGLFDLEPVRLSEINAWTKLDEAAVRRLSPLYHLPETASTRLLVAYGGRETAEFKRQSDAYAAAWSATGRAATVLERPERNHFDLVIGLGDPADSLCRATAAFMGLD